MIVRIIYDSVFGNTEKIAQAIGSGFGEEHDVAVLRVTDAAAEKLAGANLLLVGSPTRGFRPTPVLTNFLKKLAKDSLKGVKVTAFDTRIALEDVNSAFLNIMVRLFGYADKPIAALLVKKGGEMIVSTEGFIVKGSEGPLKEGELERAAGWAKQMTASV